MAAGRALIGLPYVLGAAYEETDENGQISGQTDCVGFWFLVFQRLELLPAALDISFPYAIWGDLRENTMKRILLQNFVPRKREEMQPGDLLFCAGERHAAMCSVAGEKPHFIAAQNTLGQRRGRVLERLIDFETDEIRRVVYRLKNCVEAQNG